MMKKILCIFMLISIAMSMLTAVSFADGEAAIKDGTDYIKAIDYDTVLDSNGKTPTDITKCTDGKNGKPDYLYNTWWRTFTYNNVNFKEEAPTTITIYLGAGAGNEKATITVKIDETTIGTVKPEQILGYTTPVGYTLSVSGILAEGAHTVQLTGNSASCNLFGFEFGFDKSKDGYNYIRAKDFDTVFDTNGDVPTDITYCTDGTNGKPDYLYNTWWRTFTYNNIVFESNAPTEITVYLGAGAGNESAALTVKIDGNKIGTVKPEQILGYTTPVGYTLPVTGLSAGDAHTVQLTGNGASCNFFGFEFSYTEPEKVKQGLNLVEATDYDSYTGEKSPDNTASGFRENEMASISNDISPSLNMINYISTGNSFTYENVYFEKSPVELDVFLATAEGYTGTFNVSLGNGTDLGNVTISDLGNWTNGQACTLDVTGKILAGATHDIVVKYVSGNANYMGFKFYAIRESDSYFGPDNYDLTSGTLDRNYSGYAGSPETGKFAISTINGVNCVSYAKAGQTLTYKNVKFKNASSKLTLYIGTELINKRIRVSLGDGTELATFTSDGREGSSYFKGIPYTADIYGKISANTICDIVVTMVDSGINYYGMELEEGIDSSAKVTEIMNISPDYVGSYKTVNGVRLPIKTYKPKFDNHKRTAFLIIHGGAWYAVKEDSDTWNGSNMQFQARYYADKGYPTAAISYRSIDITQSTTAYDLIEDCKDAVKWMRSNMDFDHLVIMGESSGGHLAVELGLDDEVNADAVVAFNPVLDVVNKWTYVAKNDEDRKALSPAFNVKKTDTKFLVMHGTTDEHVDYNISKNFCLDMKETGSECEYIELENEVHSFIIARYLSSDENVMKYMAMVDDYFDSIKLGEVVPEEYFDTYKSNTTAGLGNQYGFTTDRKEHTGRMFYKISAGGTYNYSFTFSGTGDSTYADGSVGRANKIYDDYTITKLRVASCKRADISNYDGKFDFKDVTFYGESSIEVEDGETVYTDPIELTFEPDDYICMEISYKGTEIPTLQDRLISSYLLQDNGQWSTSFKMPIPGFIGCEREVKNSIVFIGDSITQGVGTSINSYTHWVSEVEKLLGDDYSYRNIGLGYARAKDAATNGSWLNKAKYADTVVICLGVNDIYHDGENIGEKVCGYYDEIISALSDGKRKIIMQTVPPFDYQSAKISEWNKVNDYIHNVLANKVDAVFDVVPVLRASESEPYKTVYGQHPNADGCKLWAEALAPVLEYCIKSEKLIGYDIANKKVVINSTPEMVGDKIIIASYGEGEIMLDFPSTYDVTYNQDSPQKIDISSIIKGTEKIKVFIWDNFSDLKPVTEDKEIRITH